MLIENRFFFSLLSENTSPHVAYSNHFAPPHDNKYANIPYRACVVLVVYTLWQRRIRKTPFSSVHMSSGDRFWKLLRSVWCPKMPFTCESNRRLKRRTKKIRFKKYPDTFGRGLSLGLRVQCMIFKSKVEVYVLMNKPWLIRVSQKSK